MKKVKTFFLKLELTPVYQISAIDKFGPLLQATPPTNADTISIFTGNG